MSGFVSTVASGLPLLAVSDCRLVDDEYNRTDEFQPHPLLGLVYAGNTDFLGLEDFSTDFWPRSGYVLGASGVSDVFTSAWYQRVWPNSGCNGRLLFTGTTRDQYGSALGGCTVRCYRSSTGEMVDSGTSDANGLYRLTSPYNEAHYLTVHKTGVGGASLDTLIPS